MTLRQRLSEGVAVFGVVGLGYVGLPLVVEMTRPQGITSSASISTRGEGRRS